MSVRETLTAARELIVTKGWTQGYYARDQWDRHAEPRDPSAVCYCVLGALRCVQSTEGSYLGAVETLGLHAKVYDLVGWNDTPGRTVEEVVAAFDKALVAVGAS